MNVYKVRRQKPVKGGRTALPACVLKSIDHAVERAAARYRVSKSFVVASVLATVFEIEEQESIHKKAKKDGGK